MTIAGFTFTRMLVERKSQAKGAVNINSNIGVVSADEIDFVMGAQKQKGIKVLFDYRNTYTPDLGILILDGEIFYLSDQKRHDDLMKTWKKDKKFPDDVMVELYNIISVRGALQAIQLSSTVGLPPPIPLPKFTRGQAQGQTVQQPQQKGKKG
ncbi:hypothetical protein HYU16_03725 [Candidatus Woesearchaeota archaeon]|nr:hypothetical protein [Candidatus Woesearchaeota archaeon]